ncbi:hypothetical protein [Horticoccus sp. 23ND18S-11]|uniref:hypothetical protein n=1 Tax=Horticoccus sp. 23ND18S-11 TaxID=3391832 RepID=UPI0039C95EBB
MSAVDDPTPPPEAGGIVFIPTHGVELSGGRVPCHGLIFLRLDGQTWSNLEALWMRDQELDVWLNRERTFAAMPYTGEVRDQGNDAFARALAAYGDIVSAARLTASGVWIDPLHVAAVARSNDGTNVRLVGTGRPRLWAAVFGDALAVRGRQRKWGARVECRPAQEHLPHGPAYPLDLERAQRIERGIAMLAELRALVPHHAWWVAHRAFERGHDLFQPRRVRLTALFGGFEALFGSFRRERGDPGVGAAVATLLTRAGWEATDPAAYVEQTLRRTRNRLAHGSDLAEPIDFANIEENLLNLMRAGLGFASAWIRGLHAPDVLPAPGPARTLAAFQRWLGRAVSEDA